MVEPALEYVAARRVLLDALDALQSHLDNLILVGAQAVVAGWPVPTQLAQCERGARTTSPAPKMTSGSAPLAQSTSM